MFSAELQAAPVHVPPDWLHRSIEVGEEGGGVVEVSGGGVYVPVEGVELTHAVPFQYWSEGQVVLLPEDGAV